MKIRIERSLIATDKTINYMIDGYSLLVSGDNIYRDDLPEIVESFKARWPSFLFCSDRSIGYTDSGGERFESYVIAFRFKDRAEEAEFLMMYEPGISYGLWQDVLHG